MYAKCINALVFNVKFVWHILLNLKMGFVVKYVIFLTLRYVILVLLLKLCYCLGTSIEKLQMRPSLNANMVYLYECAWNRTIVTRCYISCKWHRFQQTNITANPLLCLTPDYIVPWRDSRCLVISVCIYVGRWCRAHAQLCTFTLTPCHCSPQGAGGVLCERKHLQGEAEAFLHQKPKVK